MIFGWRGVIILGLAAALTGCGAGNSKDDRVYAPGIADADPEDGLETGHRLMAAGQHELALRAYTRAAAEQGLNVDTLSALGSANLRLGRLGQAESLLRRATDEAPEFPPAWNNLGVLLMEQGDFAEAAEVFRRAFATDNGNSDQIRQNLALALAKRDGALYAGDQQDQIELVIRDDEDFIEPL